MIIRNEHVKPLEMFNDQAFADWFLRGFKDLHHDAKRLTAFEPLNYFVRRRGNLTDELKDIYEVLSGSAQEHFRHGIVIAFADLPPKVSSIPILRGLLHLAGRIHASEIFPVIIQQIGNGYFGIAERNEGHELFALALDIVAGMAPSLRVSDTVRRLLASSYFQPGYAPRAFIALCRTEPEEFPRHLEALRKSFTKLHSEAGTVDANITARRFVQYVDTKVLAQKIWAAYFTIDPGIRAVETDNWLGKSLFLGDNAPLRLIKFNDDFFITRRGQEQDRQNWKIDLQAGKENWSQLYNMKRFLDRCMERSIPVEWQREIIPIHLKSAFKFNHLINSKLTGLAQDSPLWSPPPSQMESLTTRGLHP